MFFSIVVPVYNVAPYLGRCVNSVLSQKFEDYELILVDDGSTDASPGLCDQYASESKKIKVIHKQNGGLSSARNCGIKLASGKYILFLDSDDLWNDTNALSELYSTIQSDNTPDLVCYGTVIFDENDKIIKTRVPKAVCGSLYGRLNALVCKNEYISTAYVKALRTDFLKENDLFFKHGILSEDVEWSGRILEKVKSIDVYENPFCKRICRSEGSITSNIGRKNISDILNAIEEAVQRICAASYEDAFRNIYYEYWAYQYAMLLSLMHYIKKESDYSSYIDRLRKLKWLLRFDHNKKVRAVEMLVTVLGIKGAVLALEMRK